MDRISGDIRKIGGRRCNCASAQESLRQKDREKENEYVYSFLARVSRKLPKEKDGRRKHGECNSKCSEAN